MAYINIDIELSEVETRYLIEELESRYIGERELKDLYRLIKSNDSGKLEFLLRATGNFTIPELEEMFKDKAPIIPSKEQIKLF
jgi:hypothetical protein